MRYYSIKPNMIFEIYSNTFRLKMNGSRIMVLKRQVVLPLIKFLLTIESTVHLQLYRIYIWGSEGRRPHGRLRRRWKDLQGYSK